MPTVNYAGNTRRIEAGQVPGGRYRILEQIGGGGSAVVWRGYDQMLDRLVAIKETQQGAAKRDVCPCPPVELVTPRRLKSWTTLHTFAKPR